MSYPGGLPPPRPDQGYAPTGAPMAPGSQTPIVRAKQVIVSGPSGAVVGVFVYNAGTTPGPGNEPIASLTNQPADPFGNPTETGVAAYAIISGNTYALQLGTVTFGATTFPAFFLQNLTSPPVFPPFIGGQTSPAGSFFEMTSGESTGGASEAAVQVQDSVISGLGIALVNLICGQIQFNGTPITGLSLPTSFPLPTAGGTAQVNAACACINSLVTILQSAGILV
jgi:hypothetical protein